jgi:hypothetical protein
MQSVLNELTNFVTAVNYSCKVLILQATRACTIKLYTLIISATVI